MLKRSNLHNYQTDVVDFFKETPKSAGFLALGLGKSVISLTAIVDLLESNEAKNVLVIAPLRVANSVWVQECRLWEHLQHLDIVRATGTLRERLTALDKRASVTVINQENIPWLVRNSGVKWRWDMIVVDESTGFKNPSSVRFKALKQVVKHIRRAILLTGTPLPNGMLDLWSQVYLLDQGERLGRLVGKYKSRYFDPVGFMGYGLQLKPNAREEIMNKISDITLTLDVDDLLEMPERVDLAETVELSKTLMTKYKKLEKEFFHELENDEGIEVLSAAALANKLLQFSSGALYDEDKKVHHVHREKIARLKEIREANPSENLLTAYNFQFEKDLLLEEFPEAVLLDAKGQAVADWNDGKIPMLLAHPASASMGLNLQKGGSVVVWYGLSWNLTHYLQFNGRVYRQGQKQHVRIIHLLAKGTMDEKVYAAIQGKAKTQQDLLDHMKLFNAEF